MPDYVSKGCCVVGEQIRRKVVSNLDRIATYNTAFAMSRQPSKPIRKPWILAMRMTRSHEAPVKYIPGNWMGNI
jgi:hypothetical protein